MKKIENYEQVKEFITAEIHNVLWIKPYLAERPFTQIYDMVVTYNVELDSDKNVATPVTWELFRNYGVDLKEFHEAAVRNTTRLHPPVINTLGEIRISDYLNEFYLKSPNYRQIQEIRTSDYPNDTVYVLTNKEEKNAAVSILDPKVMDAVTKRIGEDFYFLTSSIGSLLFFDKNVYYESELEDLVMANVDEYLYENVDENVDKNLYENVDDLILSSGVFILDIKEHSLVNLADRLKNPIVEMPHLWMNWEDGKFPPIEGKDRTEVEEVLWNGIPGDEQGLNQVGIYRLKNDPELELYRKSSISELMDKGILGENYEEIIPENYDLIYVGAGEYYPDLFPYELNAGGPSPRVGDIMVFHNDGGWHYEEIYYYSEQNGFELIEHPDFVERFLEGLMDIYYGFNILSTADMEKQEVVPESSTEEKKPEAAVKKKPEARGPKL